MDSQMVSVRLSCSYAVQLLTPASILAHINGTEDVGDAEIEQVRGIFLDAKRSALILQQHADKYMK